MLPFTPENPVTVIQATPCHVMVHQEKEAGGGPGSGASHSALEVVDVSDTSGSGCCSDDGGYDHSPQGVLAAVVYP